MSEPLETLIELRGINLSYGNDKVVRNVTLSIGRSEFIALIGHNGSGKTTLLRIMLGLISPTQGQISWPQTSVIGYVPQRGSVAEIGVPMSVKDVVDLGSGGHKRVTEQALARVDMGRFSHQRFTQLSGGQQQRVLIAKAIATNPDLLVLDEPTVGIDEPSQNAFYQLLRRLHEQGLTIIMVSHDVHMASKLASRLIYMQHHVVFDGHPRDFDANLYITHDHEVHNHSHRHGAKHV